MGSIVDRNANQPRQALRHPARRLMRFSKIQQLYGEANRAEFLGAACLLLIALTIANWLLLRNISLGYLYVFPIMLAAGFLESWQIVLLCLACSILRENFIATPWGRDFGPRVALVMTAFTGAGLFVRELARNRQMAEKHLRQIKEETRLRRDIEKELQVLVESSPAAILIADAQGKLLLANAAAQRMLGSDGAALNGQPVARYLPVLGNLQTRSPGEFLHTEMESTGRRESGEIFRAHLWVSTYGIASGSRLAAIVVDASEELRDREESGVDRLLSNSRVLMGAVAHEVRNLCGAIAVTHANLTRLPGIQQNADFRAFGNLLEGLRQLASAELQPFSRTPLAEVALESVLDDLRIVIEPSFRESGGTIEWNQRAPLPAVWADPQGLLQVFLNIAQNALRAMQHAQRKTLVIGSAIRTEAVVLSFSDTGSGVAQPERLFRPFQQGSEAVGLGLYVSRAIARSFGGNLRYEPRQQGACFAVELLRADTERENRA